MSDTTRAARFTALRKMLGLPRDWLAETLGANGNTFDRWESGKSDVPNDAMAFVESLSDETQELVEATIIRLTLPDAPKVLHTYRTNADYRKAEPDSDRPATWHQHWTARVVAEVPGLVLDYWAPNTT
ncbi:DUF1870 family protein [Nocardia sp. CS682]|uniref:Aca2/YdiL-like domain-containing protein n=1 Tax=Nocardia sp. CS682 TaxID=1047172 RepID=UPI00107555A7|nr:DUF1870 family protein [Nocardia sp. CS682]QBS43850.1 transcriptional regulator [Nocardia sp. CS682]